MLSMVLVLAFIAGFAARQLGYPPLLGYLLAGFVAHWLGWGSGEELAPIADAGVMLLLFTIGLKLRPASLSAPYVWGAALLHMLITVPLTVAIILTVGLVYQPLSFSHPESAWALAFALSFSSTVFAIKMFEERGEAQSFYAAIAIGILVIQDLLAVIYMVAVSGKLPSPWALGILLLPLLRKPVKLLFGRLGHGELLLLSGIAFAFAGAGLSELIHLKGGLGALLAGVLIASATVEKAKELYGQLSGLKNLLLVGFILQIGYYGIPSLPMVMVAVVLAALILLRPLIYFSLLCLFGLRARTSWLVGLSLFNYSEFGLIIASYAVATQMLTPDWVTTLALAMSFSFVVATPVNDRAHSLYRKFRQRLDKFEKIQRLPEEHIGTVGDATIAVLGMGRIGCAAYHTLAKQTGRRVVGIEESVLVTQRLCTQGVHCIHGDGSDRDVWERTGLVNCDLVLVSLSHHRENLAVVALAQELGFKNTLVVAARFVDEKHQLEALGCYAYNLHEDSGRDFAVYATQRVEPALR